MSGGEERREGGGGGGRAERGRRREENKEVTHKATSPWRDSNEEKREERGE